MSKNAPAAAGAAVQTQGGNKKGLFAAFDENQSSREMDLYSRQIGTFGVETMRQLVNLDVLIVGLNGVGAETAKNLILAGPKRVTLCDAKKIELCDLGTNFCFNESSVGISRAMGSKKLLAGLNEFVCVDVLSGGADAITHDTLAQYGAVVVCDDQPLHKLRDWDTFCRSHQSLGKSDPILFIIAMTRGVTATIFTDFGDCHTIKDWNGEPLNACVIETIERGKEGEFIIEVVGEKHGYDDDTPILLEEIEGASQLNGLKGLKVIRKFDTLQVGDKTRSIFDAKRFIIKLPADCGLSSKDVGEYTGGGIISPSKPLRQKKFRALCDSLMAPRLLTHPNVMKHFNGKREAQLHFAYLALWQYQANHDGKLPPLHCQKAADECVQLARDLVKEHLEKQKTVASENQESIDILMVDPLDEKVVRQVALYARAELSGCCAFLGGVAAQEIVKKFGKYTPIHQWLYIDFLELLPDQPPTKEDALGGEPSRYDHQIAVFGKKFQENLMQQKWFLVGCGALGCEFLKAFALMGVGAGAEGYIHVTDMDHIELSNLNRQFLFRQKDVGEPKSVAAAKAISQINNKLNVRADEVAVGPDTEDHFDDVFWSSLTGVCNALDNLEARRYTDSRCVFFRKPLLESGTMGTKAHAEVVVPHLTASYSEQADNAPKGGIPMCTLRNFPHLIEHCIEWSLAKFSDYFVDPPKELNLLKTNRGPFLASLKQLGDFDIQIEKIESILDLLGKVTQQSYDTCISMAFDFFEEEFSKSIRDLVHHFPKDHMFVDKESGTERQFWSGAKRFPRAAGFDINNPLHVRLLYCASNLYAHMMGVPVVEKEDEFLAILKKANLKEREWIPPRRGPSMFEDKEAAEAARSVVAESTTTMSDVMKCKVKLIGYKGFKELAPMNVAEFEKDDDSNFHIDFLTACTNLRAWNYRIKQTTRHRVKMIAGNIIPAIATTTAMITGLISIELYKLALELPLEKFCCSNVNLGVSSFNNFEPSPPGKAEREYSNDDMDWIVPVPEGFTCWDQIVVDEGDLTVQEFVEKFPSLHHGVIPELFAPQGVDTDLGNKMMYSELVPTKALKELIEKNKPRKITKVYEELYGPLPDQNYIILEGAWQSPDLSPVKIPLVKYIYKPLDSKSENVPSAAKK